MPNFENIPKMSDKEKKAREKEAQEILGDGLEKFSEEEDLVFYFSEYDYTGKDLKNSFNLTEAQLAEVLRDPKKYKEKYELFDEDIEEIEDLKEAIKKERLLQADMFRELEAQHKDNPIFDRLRECPEGMVSIYHYTGESALERIGKEGLKTTKQVFEKNGKEAEDMEERFGTERFFDEKAPKGIERLNSVYAYPEFRGRSGMEGGNVILEVYVDPEKVLVCNADYFTEASSNLRRGNDNFAQDHRESYWKTAMTYKEYMDLPEERKKSFGLAEVLIPNGVEQENIKARGITFLT